VQRTIGIDFQSFCGDILNDVGKPGTVLDAGTILIDNNETEVAGVLALT